MKIKDGFTIKKIGGSNVVLFIGDGEDPLGGMLQMNDTAAFMWESLEKGCSREDLIRAFLDKYDVDEDTAGADIDAALETFIRNGIITG